MLCLHGSFGPYVVGRVNGGEGALEAAHLLAANVGLAEVSPKQVVVAILDRRCPVVFRSKLVRVVTEQGAFAVEEVAGVIGVAGKVEVGRIAARLGLAYVVQYCMRSSFGGSAAELTSINLV
jgi:hypothetical protein